MTEDRPPTRTRTILVIVTLLAAPLLYLAPSVIGPRTYVPFDLARFPPVSTTLTPADQAKLDEQPSNFDVTEIPALVVPEMQLARRERSDGRFPGWNPYARFGAPLYANGLAAMAYPPNQLLLLRGDPQGGLGLAAWLSFAIAGLLAFGFLREMDVSTIAALFGALVFALGGTLAANGHFYMRMNALIWLPGMCWAVLRIGRHHGMARMPAVAALAACTAMTLLAGFPPFAVSALLAAGMFSTCVLLRTLGFDGPVPMLRVSGFLLGGVLLGAMLAAVQLLPMFRFFPESNREIAAGLESLRGDAFATMGLIGYVAPDLFGFPGQLPAYQQSPLVLLLQDVHRVSDGALQYPPNYNLTEYAVYLGTLPLLLALLGIFGPARRCRLVVVVSAVALFVLASTPTALAAWYSLPVVGSVPPIRYVGPVAIFGAVLAAFGLEHVLADRARRRVVLIGALGIAGAITCFVIAGRAPLADHDAVIDTLVERYRPGAPTLTHDVVAGIIGDQNLTAGSQRLVSGLDRAGWALLATSLFLLLLVGTRRSPRVRAVALAAAALFTVGELWTFGAPLNTGRVLRHDIHDTPIHAFLRERRDAERDRGGITIARAAKVPHEPIELPSGTLFPERIRDLNAYAFVDAWSSRVFRALYGDDQMMRGYWPKDFPDDTRLERPMFDLFGLRYVLSTERLQHAGRKTDVELHGPGGDFYVYERPSALPRAFVVPAVRELPDDDAVVAALVARDLEPRAAVLLTPTERRRLGDATGSPGAADRRARFVRDVPDHVVLDVDAGPAGFLVLADSALTGWTATIDDRPTAIARGDLFMRVVALPAGPCRVEFRYTPPGLTSGIWLTSIGLAALIALLAIGFRSRRDGARADPAT